MGEKREDDINPENKAKSPDPSTDPLFKDFFGGRFSTAPYSRSKESLLEQFASSEGGKAFLEPGVPEVERRASADLAALEAYAEGKRGVISGHGRFCPAAIPGHKAICNCKVPVAPAAPSPIFSESWASYRSALYAIHGTLSTAHSLLHNECMRTPCGSDAWETLLAFSKKVNAISEALQKEIERVPQAGNVE